MSRFGLVIAVLGLAACVGNNNANDGDEGGTDGETGGSDGSCEAEVVDFQRTNQEAFHALWGDGQSVWATGFGIAVTGTAGAITDASPIEFAYGDRVTGAGGHVFMAGFGAMMEFADDEWIRHDGPEAQVFGLWAAAPDEVWLVTTIEPDCTKCTDPDMPYAARWDGTKWIQDTPPTTAGLQDVWGASADDFHVVTSFGTAFRRLDDQWIEMDTGASSVLTRVRGNRADNVWAVGNTGEVVRFDGAAWSAAPPVMASPDIYFISLWVAADDTVYVLGTSLDPDGTSQVMRLETDVWMPFGPPIDGMALDLWGDDAALWVAGMTDGPVLDRIALDDPSQTTVEFHIQDLGQIESLVALDAEHAVAVSGLKYFAEYRDGQWSGRTLGNYVQARAAWAAGVDNAFVAAYRAAAEPVGTTFRVQGDEVHEFPVPAASDLSLHAIWGRSDSDVWTGGDDPNGPRLLHFDGMAWTDVEPPPSAVARLHGDAERLVAATSNGLFVQENGTWAQLPTPQDLSVTDTIVSEDGTIWAVVGGALHRVQDGVAIPELDAPEGVVVALTPAPGGLVVVGDSSPSGDMSVGFAARLAGSTWNPLATAEGIWLAAGWSDDSLFVAGYDSVRKLSCTPP